MKLFEDGDWYIYVYDNYMKRKCLRHTACEEKEGKCACNGYCYTCNVKSPDAIKGFFELVKWNR